MHEERPEDQKSGRGRQGGRLWQSSGNKQLWQTFSAKSQTINISSAAGHTDFAATTPYALECKSSLTQYVNRHDSILIKLYLWTLTCEFHIKLTCHKMSSFFCFFFFKPLKNVKTILSLQSTYAELGPRAIVCGQTGLKFTRRQSSHDVWLGAHGKEGKEKNGGICWVLTWATAREPWGDELTPPLMFFTVP